MGTLDENIGISLEAGFGKPLSRADVYAYCESVIKAPPIPPEFKSRKLEDFLNTTYFRVAGVPHTVIDYYREQLLKPSLDKIAAGPTLAMQRAECIWEVLDLDLWQNLHSCLNAAKTDLGRFVMDERLKIRFASQGNEKQRADHAFIWFLMAILVRGCLLSLGKALLGVDENTELQMDMCRKYGQEIIMSDVNIMDYIWQHHADERELAMELTDLKYDHVNPITQQMSNLLEATKNKVIYGTFDLAEFQTAAKRLEEERLKAVQFIERKA